VTDAMLPALRPLRRLANPDHLLTAPNVCWVLVDSDATVTNPRGFAARAAALDAAEHGWQRLLIAWAGELYEVDPVLAGALAAAYPFAWEHEPPHPPDRGDRGG
jgi:hypothetical protein